MKATKLGWRAAVLMLIVAESGLAQERNMTLTGPGTLEGRREGTRNVREVRLTLRGNSGFAATVVLPDTTLVLGGTWRRPGVGNVDRIELRDVSGRDVRGDGTLVYADRDHRIPRRLSLQWTSRNENFRLEVGSRDRDEDDDDVPGGWSAGSGTQVFRNIDARATGEGDARMSGVRGGAFSLVRARIGRGGDVILDVDRPTRGEIRGRVRRVQGRRIEFEVNRIFGYAATGEMTVRLRSADEVRSFGGSGAGGRGEWAIDFRGTGLPNDIPRPGDNDPGNDDGNYARVERGSGTLRQDVGPTIDVVGATVRLDRDRDAHISLEGRRDRITIEGRWSESSSGRVEMEVRRINDRSASGTVIIRRDGRSFSSIQGDGRTQGGRFSVEFTAR